MNQYQLYLFSISAGYVTIIHLNINKQFVNKINIIILKQQYKYC